jgi:ATP synthase protein I
MGDMRFYRVAAMSDDASSPTPKDIEARLQKLQAGTGSQGDSSDKTGQGSPATEGLAQAMRIGVELVSALLVGGGIGYGLDFLFGTRPWMMVVFFFVGSAAGIMNVWRVVSGQGYQAGYRDESSEDKEPPKR